MSRTQDRKLQHQRIVDEQRLTVHSFLVCVRNIIPGTVQQEKTYESHKKNMQAESSQLKVENAGLENTDAACRVLERKFALHSD